MLGKLGGGIAEELRKIGTFIDTPGAFQAKRNGCYLEVYRVLYSLYTMGVRPATILDVGANWGMFSRTAHVVFPNARIYAFEPLRDCYQSLCQLKETVRELECYNVALADENGEASIHRSDYTQASSLLPMGQIHKEAFPYTAAAKVEKVQKKTMDSILTDDQIRRPVLMKIDVQGYESFVLKGAERVLRSTDYVLCEISLVPMYEGQALFDELYHQLTSAGFCFAGQTADLRHPKSLRVFQIDGLFRKKNGTWGL